MANNGYEYALTLMIVSLTLLIQGAGSYSVDNLLTRGTEYSPKLQAQH